MQQALERTGGVQIRAAELLRMSERSFRYYAKKYGIRREGEEILGREGRASRRPPVTSRAAFPAALLALALAACTRPGPAGAPAAPAPGPGPRVVLPSGAAFSVELALTDAERAQGLMYRESLADGRRDALSLRRLSRSVPSG